MHATSYLKELLQSFVEQRSFAWPDKAVIEPPKDKSFGDMAANLAMVLAAQAKTAPRNVAEEICAFALENGQELAAAEVAGPGFINFTFKPEFWQQCVPEIMAAKDAYGSSDVGKGRKIQVEYVSANPTGPLHIGHGRGAAVGDSLARILRCNGSEVETEYYINDAGRQMRLLGLSVWVRLQQARGKKIDLPEDCYKGDYIRSIAATVMEKNPSIVDTPAEDEEDAIAFCREVAMNSILGGIKEDLAAFGVEHQVWFSEKSLLEQGAVDKTFALLKERGLGYEEDGAFWFKTTELGDDKDRVLRKSDGSLTYFASDIAYHDNKYDRGFDLVVDIWGADHHGYIPRMKAAVQALGRAPEDLEVILVQLVNLLRGGEQIAMSTRAGQFETLGDVCEEVGSDAARFMFLTRKSDSPLDFDLDLVKQKTMDNPVYYVQYAHARIRSVERKAAQEGVRVPNHAPAPEILARLDTDEDMDLLKRMARFPGVVNSAAEHLSPHFISYYLQELAGTLHRYYTMHQVLAAPDKDTVQARLALLAAVSQVLRNGLSLLGVSAPDRM